MPYVSDQQRKKFHVMLEHGQIDKETVDEWDNASRGKKLPKKVKKKSDIELDMLTFAQILDNDGQYELSDELHNIVEAAKRKTNVNIGSKQAEAIYAFMAWLTTRKEESGPFGNKCECSEAAELVDEFCKSQGWKVKDDRWFKKLKPYPKDKIKTASIYTEEQISEYEDDSKKKKLKNIADDFVTKLHKVNPIKEKPDFKSPSAIIMTFQDGTFGFYAAHYGSWAQDKKIIFRVREDSNPRKRAEEKGIKNYDRIFPATEYEVKRWLDGHPQPEFQPIANSSNKFTKIAWVDDDNITHCDECDIDENEADISYNEFVDMHLCDECEGEKEKEYGVHQEHQNWLKKQQKEEHERYLENLESDERPLKNTWRGYF
jgi:hypothetical protein